MAQFLTVMNGGKLIQHVEGHTNNSHRIQLQTGKVIKIAGDHHQMMYPFDLKKTSYELIGYSENHLSPIYWGQNNKNIEIPFSFFEPEIVYYPNTNSFCVQSHPEWEIGSQDSDLVLKMIDKYLFNTKQQSESYKNPFINDQFFEEDFEIHEHIPTPVQNSNNSYGIGISEKPLKKTQQYRSAKIGKWETSFTDKVGEKFSTELNEELGKAVPDLLSETPDLREKKTVIKEKKQENGEW